MEKPRAKPSAVYEGDDEWKSIEAFELPEKIQGELGSTSSIASSSTVGSRDTDANKWMAFDREAAVGDKPENSNSSSDKIIRTEAGIVERTAEWGLVVKADPVGGGSFRAVGSKNFQTAESSRTSEESNYGHETSSGSFIPRVSQELKEALATLQQTFVVSDARKPECPIMYASSGFFGMTGYSSEEVIGRNWDHLMVDKRRRRSKQHRRLPGAPISREGGALPRGKRCSKKSRERRAPVAGGEAYVDEGLGVVTQLGCNSGAGSDDREKPCERGSISRGGKGEGLHCGRLGPVGRSPVRGNSR